jgi:two-component system, cell cycle sensor histidine kinase and response regulator CckA
MEGRCGSGTILVVEDEELVADLARDILQRFGYSVLVVNNGREAIDLYRQRSRDIAAVVLDMIMPEMDGCEVFQRLRAVNPQVRVIVSTGCDRAPDIDAMLQQGAAGFLQKPFRIAELAEAVAEAVEGKRLIQDA